MPVVFLAPVRSPLHITRSCCGLCWGITPFSPVTPWLWPTTCTPVPTKMMMKMGSQPLPLVCHYQGTREAKVHSRIHPHYFWVRKWNPTSLLHGTARTRSTQSGPTPSPQHHPKTWQSLPSTQLLIALPSPSHSAAQSQVPTAALQFSSHCPATSG